MKQELFDLFNIDEGNWHGLWLAHLRLDQALMKRGAWDAQHIVLRRANEILLKILPELKGEDESYAIEMLWIYHHHAISWALYRAERRDLAHEHAWLAVIFHALDNPNRLTKLFYLLLEGRKALAREWAKLIPETVRCSGDTKPMSNPEKPVAEEILSDFASGRV
jgi:hypothetical protein